MVNSWPRLFEAECQKTDILTVEPSINLDNIKVSELLKSRPRPFPSADDIQTISVDVFSIIGNAATLISKSPDIFYDTEILVVVHRVKSGASGLATTTVWCWLGKNTRLGDREEKKLRELANRYGTSAVGPPIILLMISSSKSTLQRIFHQLAEPVDLVVLLGGCLAIRQVPFPHSFVLNSADVFFSGYS